MSNDRPRFMVMLYVNRSGSTLLSRLLSDASNDLFVFPELAFPLWLLLERSAGRRLAGKDLHALIAADPRIDALPLASGQLRSLCEEHGTAGLATLLSAIATACLGRTPAGIVLKLERFAEHLDALTSALDDPLIVHLVRDPRAVVSSMMRAPVPEKAGFTMARGDALFAARHWRGYVRRVEGRPTACVRYEELLERPDNVVGTLLGLLRVRATDGVAESRYRTSSVDRALHPNVFASVMPARSAGWRTELPDPAIRLVEHVCGREMRAFGYVAETGAMHPASLTRAQFSHWRRSLAHALSSAALYASRPDRGAALRRRVREALAARRWR